jgi:hypothetical protein
MVIQIMLVGVVSGVWGLLLFGFLSLTTKAEALSQAETEGQTETTIEVMTPTHTATLAPPTTTPQATATPTQLVTPPTVKATVVNQAAADTATVAPSPTPTVPPLPTNTPTSAPTEPPPPTEQPEPIEQGGVSFKNNVMPIIERRCIKCHGGVNDDGEERIEEGLKLTSYEDILAGSWNGPVIEPSDAEKSYLIEQVVKGKMPKKEPRLLPKEIQILTEWVLAGAPNN